MGSLPQVPGYKSKIITGMVDPITKVVNIWHDIKLNDHFEANTKVTKLKLFWGYKLHDLFYKTRFH